MGLNETLQKIKQDAGKRIPAEYLPVMARATAALEASGQAERSLAVGERMPTFSLKDQDDVIVSSEDLLGRAPLVLLFYRGVW